MEEEIKGNPVKSDKIWHDEAMISQITALGFSRKDAKKALKLSGDVNAAVTLILESGATVLEQVSVSDEEDTTLIEEQDKKEDETKSKVEVFTSKFEKKKDNRYDLNDEKFQYVIFGTGLTESIVGASLAMKGKKCLFLDKSDKYGGTISNFNLDQFLGFCAGQGSGPFHSFKIWRPLDKNNHSDIMKDA